MESQVWRHANSQETAKRLAQYHTCFPELVVLHTSLDSYAICEKHYNQIIATNKFYQHLIGSNQENKRSRLDLDNDIRAIGVKIAVNNRS